MTVHVVVQGDCMTSIAEQYGYFWQTLWNAPENKPLRDAGRHPNMLLPGDAVTIPEKKVTDYTRATGAKYTWKVKGVPAKLRLRFATEDNPRANEPFSLDVEGTIIEGTTDNDGRIDVTIPPRARWARLRFGDGDDAEEYELDLGHLNPVDDTAGVQARLRNLGFDCPVSGALDDATRAAVRSFQATHGLHPTGELDDGTRSKIRDAADVE